ncbi:MAG: hypothetical protein KJ995_00985 [Candidatus Omnitrophica bacterium]|nr:hypothetical protein [Candidatus Omnitrophota bacterium]MBU1127887.1 hypothetical protein [Candidatus Omnitrophota bacterium]MBU1783827.1 hypothetical protein [Candidatus Omnitrophota bacterium]MBU1850966.1 hypothetical protein [Candidatus Omnitrophota bacterium]
MKFHWPLFSIVTLGICLVFCVSYVAFAGDQDTVRITSPIGESAADEKSYGEYMEELEAKERPYRAPEEDIGGDIEQVVGGQIGQSISETLLPGSETDEVVLPPDWEKGKN